MEAATPLRHPKVRTVGDRVAIDDLLIDDDATVRLVRKREDAGEDPVGLIEDAIEIGARVLDREHTGVHVEFVKAEFERTSREVESAFAERAAEVGEELAKRLEAVFHPESGQLSRELVRLFGEGSSDAVQNRVKEIVADLLAKQREETLRQFSSADDRNPLADFKTAATGAIRQMGERQDVHLRDLAEKMAALEKQLQALQAERHKQLELAEAEEAGTRKGRTFEEAVYEAIEQIALAQGDACESVGDVKGATGKTGDVLVDVDGATGPSRGRIVFEAKNSKLPRPKAMAELDEALAQRDADFAVMVVASEEKLPARTQPLREHNGDKMLVAYDPEEGSTLALTVAYSLARARVLMSRRGAEAVDAAALGDTVQRALDAMGDVRKVKSQLTGATTSIDNARGVLEAMERAVRDQLEQINALLAAVPQHD
jgi:hypothetical protein